MDKSLKKQFDLQGLHCANCANKIEDKISKISWVKEAKINFATKTLTLESEGHLDDEKINELQYIVNSVESGVILKEKKKAMPVKTKMKVATKATSDIPSASCENKKVYLLQGLNCAGCAAKIEDKVGRLPMVKEASLDFVSKKLIIDLENNKEDVDARVRKIVNDLEPDVSVKGISVDRPRSAYALNAYGAIEEKEHHELDHSHDEDHGDISKEDKIKFVVGSMFFVAAFIVRDIEWLKVILFLISYILVGGHVVVRAAKNILKGQVFDENFLMAIATIGAFAIKEYPEAVAVMIFYQIGELFQDAAVSHSRKSIGELMNIRPDYATIKVGNEEKIVDPEKVNINDIIIVKPGERIPLDGKIIEGEAQIDTSALTGESVPRKVSIGDEVLGGCINTNGVLNIKVTKVFGESTVAKILDLVENAGAKKAPTEKFITKFARYYTPVVVFLALALAVIPPILNGGHDVHQWIYRGLSFLVVSCPCALVVSIPLGFFGGIGAASKNGILVKGGNYLEALNKVDTVVFDKTGTLTKGVFKVTKIHTESWINESDLMYYASYGESYSNHPIAKSIITAYGKEIDKSKVSGLKEISGHGLQVNINEKTILLGNSKLMEKEDITHPIPKEIGTIVHVAIDKRYAGYIVISDEIKEDSKRAIELLKKAGVKNTIMLTGDNEAIAKAVSEEIGLDKYYSQLLPQDKVEKLDDIDKVKQGKMIFIGDGINDAPVLARADIGIAMGGIGSDAAIEAADVVIMTDEPSKIAQAINIAKATQKIVWQNIIIALVIKVAILILVAMGLGNMWEAVFGDVGVALIAIVNSARVLKLK